MYCKNNCTAKIDTCDMSISVEPLPVGDLGLSAFGVIPSLTLYVRVSVFMFLAGLALQLLATEVDKRRRP